MIRLLKMDFAKNALSNKKIQKLLFHLSKINQTVITKVQRKIMMKINVKNLMNLSGLH